MAVVDANQEQVLLVDLVDLVVVEMVEMVQMRLPQVVLLVVDLVV